MGLAELSPEEFVGALLPTMFCEGTSAESVDEFAATMLAFHPVGFRAMARASAEDLRDALPHVRVPTLLVYGDKDVRAPLTVAENLLLRDGLRLRLLLVRAARRNLGHRRARRRRRAGRPRPPR
jgi:pimeloyl-ACP methyl ester carboxylesterase